MFLSWKQSFLQRRGSDSCISSNPCGRTRFLSGQHCHNQCPAAVVPRVLPKHLPIPQNCVWNARPNVWGVIFLQLVFGKIMLLAELLHFFEYGCISGKLMSFFQEYHKNICIWHRLCTSDKLAVFQSCWFYGVLNFFFSDVAGIFLFFPGTLYKRQKLRFWRLFLQKAPLWGLFVV